MHYFISHLSLKLIRFFPIFLGLLLIFSLTTIFAKDKFADIRQGKILFPSGRFLQVSLAIAFDEQQRGLSGRKKSDFSDNQAMLFFYFKTEPRSFWMPDTYFNLDIVFLDKNLKVIEIERNVKAHPGMAEPPKIAVTKTVVARHVLEIRADSKISKEIKIGGTLKWSSPHSLQEIELKIRLVQ